MYLRVLPGCQDTGTAIVVGKKGQFVFTEGADEEALSKGAYLAYTTDNLRYSQVRWRGSCMHCGRGFILVWVALYCVVVISVDGFP